MGTLDRSRTNGHQQVAETENDRWRKDGAFLDKPEPMISGVVASPSVHRKVD